MPYPGELGQRIFENVSAEGWRRWIERQTMIINENGLSTIDPASLEILEQHLLGFIFKEGDMGQQPEGLRPPGSKKQSGEIFQLPARIFWGQYTYCRKELAASSPGMT